MKKYSFLVALVIAFISASQLFGQNTNTQNPYSEDPLPFFNQVGDIRLQTTEMDALADTIAIVNHRADDIVWSRIVYRVIDMRYKPNYQLYFPTRPTERNRSLLKVMLDAIVDGLNVYRRSPRDIMPMFDQKLTGAELSHVFAYDDDNYNNILQVDTITEQRSINMDYYTKYVQNQLKFLIKEVIFFDKHTSRVYTKIIAIAPMYALHPDNMENKNSMAYFRNSIICWLSWDELRPYLIKQFVVSDGNDNERLTFDDFFIQRLYFSYLLGESNLYSRMLLDYNTDEGKLRAEQKRIQTELINFEDDLWEY